MGYFGRAVAAFTLAWSATAVAATDGAIQLKVLNASMNTETRTISVELQNQSFKVVTAYMLAVSELDGSGKILVQMNVGIDGLAYNPGGDKARDSDLIQPGAISSNTRLKAVPDAVSVQEHVSGVVYSDRTWEGTQDTVGPLFGQRSFIAQNLKKAINVLSGYPATPQAFRSAIQAAREIDPGHTSQVLYANFRLPAELATDPRHALPATVTVPDRRDWQAALDSLSTEAEFWTRESQEAAK
jgi:hypothetical protein